MTHQLVRLDNPDVRVVGTSETVLAMYPIGVVRGDDGAWSWDYTGGESRIYDECSEQRVEGGQPVFQDENGEDVLESNVGVLDTVTGVVVPLKAEV